METRRFFSDNPLSGDTVTVTGEEYYHITKVNRKRQGDSIEVVDGKGSLYLGEIREIRREAVSVTVREKRKEAPPPLRTIIAPPLLKRKPMNLLIEKLSEMGVDEIRPVMFARTDTGYNPSLLEKWNRIASQSLKVNKKLWVSRVYPPVKIEEIVSFSKKIAHKIVLDIRGEIGWDPNPGLPLLSLIGPPGDLEESERELLIKNGFFPYRVNPYTLKSETAALSIAALLQSRFA